MRFTHRQHRWIATITSIALLVAQGLTAVHACDLDSVRTVASSVKQSDCASMMEKQSGSPENIVGDKLACNDHCLEKSQAQSEVSGKVPTLPASSVGLLLALDTIAPSRAYSNFRILRITAPPNITPSRLLI